MLTLYYKPTCPFCQRVLAAAEDMRIRLDLKNIVADPALREELISRGGKGQVPYLVDPERGVEMYESEDIIAYLNEHYGQQASGTFNGLRVHQSEEICDSCQ
jgi:glutaredoxin 3